MFHIEVGKTYRTKENCKVKITRKEHLSSYDSDRYYGVLVDLDPDNEAPFHWDEQGYCFTEVAHIFDYEIIFEWQDINLVLGHHYKTCNGDTLLYYCLQRTIAETTAGKKESVIYKFINETTGKTCEYYEEENGLLNSLNGVGYRDVIVEALRKDKRDD